MTDIIDFLTGNAAVEARDRRPQARENAQASFTALFEADGALPERFTVAARIAAMHGVAAEFYADLAADEPGTDPGRVRAALDFTELLVHRPADATPADVEALAPHFDATEIVTLAQTIAFVTFQLRVVHGLAVMTRGGGAVVDTRRGPAHSAEKRFSTATLGWRAWVEPLKKSELTDAHLQALIKPERANMPYFRLLVRNPEALKSRTLTDLDIFYNTDGGLSRADREFAATLASRFNACPYCASVHQRRAKEEGADEALLDALIDNGVHIDFGSAKLNAMRDAAIALTRTPVEFDASNVDDLRREGFDDLDLVDFIYSVAFFNWANRLMLSLGETTY